MKMRGINFVMLGILLFIVLALAGCGSESNPFHPDTAGEFCDVHGGVQLIEQGYIYCNDGTYTEESAL